MSNNFTLNENLLRYLDKELDDTETAAMEEALKNSSVLREDLESFQLSRYAVTHLGIRESVKEVHLAYQKNNAAQLRSGTKKRWLMVAAAAASVALILFLYLGNNNKKLTPENLYASNYRSFEITNSRGTDNNILTTLFAEKKYTAVITNFEKITNPGLKEKFIAAMGYYQLEQAVKGDQLLQELLNSNQQQNTITYKDDAEYYLGMSYLKQKNYAKALQLLEPIATNKNHLYSDVINSGFIKDLRKLPQ